MTAAPLVIFIVAFLTWVFPLLSLAIFSYSLALHSKKDTGAVHFFFAAFAAFSWSLIFLIDYDVAAGNSGYLLRPLVDLLLLVGLALAATGSSGFLSVQGIGPNMRRRQVLEWSVAAFVALAGLSLLLGLRTVEESLQAAISAAAMVGLGWVYLIFGDVARQHFGGTGRRLMRLSQVCASVIFSRALLAVVWRGAASSFGSRLWLAVDGAVCAVCTVLLGVVVVFVFLHTRRRGISRLILPELRARKFVRKRTMAFIAIPMLIAIGFSFGLMRRSVGELGDAAREQVEERQLSRLLGVGSHLQGAFQSLAACVQGLAVASQSQLGELSCDENVFESLARTARGLVPCWVAIYDNAGGLVQSNDGAEGSLRVIAALRQRAEEGTSGPGVKVFFIGSDVLGQPAFALSTGIASVDSGADGYIGRVVLWGLCRDLSERLLVPCKGFALNDVFLVNTGGKIVCASAPARLEESITGVLGIPQTDAPVMLAQLLSPASGCLSYTEGGTAAIVAHAPVVLGNLHLSLVGTGPWALVRQLVANARHVQTRFLGFVIFMILLGSGAAIAISTRWGRALERVVEAKTQQLQEEKAKLEQALRSIGNPLMAVDRQMRITYQNAEFVSAFGEHKGEVCHKALFARDAPCDGCVARKSLETHQVCHATVRSNDGVEARCFDVTASPKRDDDGNVVGSIILLKDITHKDALEQKIKESEERYRRLVEASPNMVCILQDGRLVYANKVFIDKLGYTPQELFSNDFDLISRLLHPDSQEAARSCLQTLESAQQAAQEAELCLLTKQGQPIEVLFKGVVITLGGRQAIEGILVDITNLKQLHKQLLQAERLASVGELTASIAHELNNKLAPILAYSQMLQVKHPYQDTNNKLAVIEKCATGAKSVIQSLLAFSRSSASMREYVDLNRVMRETIQLVKYRLDACNIDLIMDLDAQLPKTVADPKQIEQVFLNVVNNAYQAMEERGGTLHILSYLQDNQITFQITDTGPGIPESDLLRIFDPFFTTKPPGKGTGLGLSCSYGIIRAHNGTIYATSKLGRGTTFTIRLPVVKGQPRQEQRKEEHVRPAQGRKATILVVDDEETLREMISEILSPQHTVFEASDGRDAIDLLTRKQIDIVVMDLRMPGLDGFALYEWVKSNKPGLERRILFTTGDIYDSRTREFVRSVDSRCISKPFSVQDFLQQINSLLADSSVPVA